MLPGFVEPALAALVATPPATAAWRHEVKFDGYRLLVRIQAGGVQMFTRSGLDWTAKFASLVQPMLALPVREAMLDGEAVVIGEDGASSFGGLQQALSEGAHERIQLYLFDALFIDGEDLRPQPLDERQSRLERLLLRRRPGKARVLLSEVFDMPGRTVLAQACALGLEGIVSKRRDAPYRSGRRGDWLKSKCLKGQEFVIAGYTRSDKPHMPFRSLLLGVNEGGRLIHVGNVGTGFTRDLASELRDRMDALRVETPTLDAVPRADARRAVWIKPELVCEVAFAERTADGELRHPSFKGLRGDKNPREVIWEKPRA